MFRKRIGDQSESKIDSDKIPAKKDQARFAGPLRGAFGLKTLSNTVGYIHLDELKLRKPEFISFKKPYLSDT